jgi:hypothetical protein
LTDTARCTEGPLGCPCGGDEAVHAGYTATPQTAATVECPECGEPSSPQRVAAWGHCRVCHTADSRTKSPLRW